MLSWADELGDEDGFRIERSADGAWSEIAVVGRDVTSLTDNGLDYGALYSYRVLAYNGSGVSGYSNIASAETWALYFTIDLTPPEITIASPADGATISGRLSMAVGAADDQALVRRVGISPWLSKLPYATGVRAAACWPVTGAPAADQTAPAKKWGPFGPLTLAASLQEIGLARRAATHPSDHQATEGDQRQRGWRRYEACSGRRILHLD